MTCSWGGCENSVYRKGLCRKHDALRVVGITEDMFKAMHSIDLDADEDNEIVVNSYHLGGTNGTPVIDFLMQRYLDTHDNIWLEELRSML